MKYGIKKLNEDELAMMVSIASIDPFDAKSIMICKGDVENPTTFVPPHMNDDSWCIPSKSMKRADRRKRTYHKQQQRERQYRNLGYSLERFSKADLGKMKEGVGMFPKTQHQYSMYNRGEKKGEKPITTKQAISMMEHERLLDEQDALAEYKEAERLFAMDFISDLMYEVKLTDIKLDEEEERLSMLLDWVEKAQESISSKRAYKESCLKKIEKIKEDLNK